MKDCVLRFDENLSLKADRWTLEKVLYDIPSIYLDKSTFEQELKNIRELNKKINKDLNDSKEIFSQQESMLQVIVQKLVTQMVEKRMANYEEITKKFNKFFS